MWDTPLPCIPNRPLLSQACFFDLHTQNTVIALSCHVGIIVLTFLTQSLGTDIPEVYQLAVAECIYIKGFHTILQGVGGKKLLDAVAVYILKVVVKILRIVPTDLYFEPTFLYTL